jgi:NCS1 family nucleobase:cation symporter-1
VAVPLMLLVGAGLTWALWRLPTAASAVPDAGVTLWRGFDIVVGYQVSWLLMFADYSRYTRSPAMAGTAVFSGLLFTSVWFMPLGFVAARLAGSLDPGLMLDAAGLGLWGVLLLALATVTTNFVNLYMSTLAWKMLVPRAADQPSVWSIGLLGTALGLFSTSWLERYADFMLLLGAVLVPVGGLLLAHYVVLQRRPTIAELYDRGGRLMAVSRGFRVPGLVAWAAGASAYFAASQVGSTLPAMVTAIAVYLLLDRVMTRGRPPRFPAAGLAGSARPRAR